MEFRQVFFAQTHRLASAFLAVLCLFLVCGTGCDSCQNDTANPNVEQLQPIRAVEQLAEYRRSGRIPEKIDRIYCSGGTLRLAVYMECADRVVAVDSNEKRNKTGSDMKAYLAAHPEFLALPLGGETSGRDNPELLLSLENPPQLIIKAETRGGYDPAELTRRTGIPVLLVPMRGLTTGRAEFDAGLRLLGAALDKTDRAEALIEFFDTEIEEIQIRTKKWTALGRKKPLAYVGGVSFGGAHAFNATEAGYPPFVLTDVNTPIRENENDPRLDKRHATIAKEKILHWDPDVLFLDLGTLDLGSASGLAELHGDPAYRSLSAVQKGNVFTLLPNTHYFVNHDAVLINAWFIAQTLYPEQFADIDPKKKADEIFTFLVGKPVFDVLNADVQNLALDRLDIQQ